MSDEIRCALIQAHAIWRRRKLGLMVPVQDRKYADALAHLFYVTGRPPVSEFEVRQAHASLVAENRKSEWEHARNDDERREAAELLLDLMLPFERRMTSLMRWSAIRVLKLGSNGTVLSSERFRNWSPDQRLALAADLGASIEAVVQKAGAERKARWQQLYDVRLREELVKRGLLGEYLSEMEQQRSVDEARAEYECNDRLSSACRTLLDALEHSGMDAAQRWQISEAYAEEGYEAAKALVPNQFARTIEWTDRERARTALSWEVVRELKRKSDAHCFEVPDGLRNTIWRGIYDSEAGDLYRLGRESLRMADSQCLWRRLEFIDRDLFLEVNYGVSEALRSQKAFAVDRLVRMADSLLWGLEKFLEPNVHPVDALERLIEAGNYRRHGVPPSARLAPAIGRAVETEQNLLRYYLEFAGPDSPWTLALALLHRGTEEEWRRARDAQLGHYQEIDAMIAGL